MYSCTKIHSDLRDIGEQCAITRVHRLMIREGLRAQVGYRRPRHRGGESHVAVPNRLNREFNPAAPDEFCGADITHAHTHEGWLYLPVVEDLFSLKVIGWLMQQRSTQSRKLIYQP